MEQDITEWKLVKRQLKESPEPRRKKWIEYNASLQALIEDYDNVEDKLDFLQRVGTLMSVLMIFFFVILYSAGNILIFTMVL